MRITAAASFGAVVVDDLSITYSRPTESFAITRAPRHTAHVIATFFPVARLIAFEEANAFDPLGRLPRVKLRDDQTNGTAVFGWNRLAVVCPGEERIVFQEILDWQVGGPTVVVSQGQNKFCFRLYTCESCDFARRDSAPNVVQPGPARDAVKVGINAHRRQLHKLVERPDRKSTRLNSSHSQI